MSLCCLPWRRRHSSAPLPAAAASCSRNRRSCACCSQHVWRCKGAPATTSTDIRLARRMVRVMWRPWRRLLHAAQRRLRCRRSMERRSRAQSSGSPGCPRCPERAPSRRTPTARWGPACSAAPALRRPSRRRESSTRMLHFQPTSLSTCSLKRAVQRLIAARSAQSRGHAMRSRPIQQMLGLGCDSGVPLARLPSGQPGLTSEYTRGCSADHILLPGLQAVLECQAA